LRVAASDRSPRGEVAEVEEEKREAPGAAAEVGIEPVLGRKGGREEGREG